mmetsp:Transcript_36823/g.93344  ORF Transcript_36823/g.93344 Transcript_36823/m.93344 type:complete len:195 (-) Transcript_36823:122-706(-)
MANVDLVEETREEVREEEAHKAEAVRPHLSDNNVVVVETLFTQTQNRAPPEHSPFGGEPVVMETPVVSPGWTQAGGGPVLSVGPLIGGPVEQTPRATPEQLSDNTFAIHRLGTSESLTKKYSNKTPTVILDTAKEKLEIAKDVMLTMFEGDIDPSLNARDVMLAAGKLIREDGIRSGKIYEIIQLWYPKNIDQM